MAGLRDAGARPVMSALPPRVTPVSKDDALVLVLEAYIETLKAENAILRRWLAAAEARAAQETEKAEAAVAELSALTRLRTRAAALGDDGSRDKRGDQLAAERARPWWRRLASPR
jgi:hypothetical protein